MNGNVMISEAVRGGQPATRAAMPLSLIVLGVAILCLVDIDRIGGMALSGGPPEIRETSVRIAIQTDNCAICGTVESIRSTELRGSAPDFETAAGVLSRPDFEVKTGRRIVYRVAVRMDDGSSRSLSLPDPPSFAVGDKIRVIEVIQDELVAA